MFSLACTSASRDGADQGAGSTGAAEPGQFGEGGVHEATKHGFRELAPHRSETETEIHVGNLAPLDPMRFRPAMSEFH